MDTNLTTPARSPFRLPTWLKLLFACLALYLFLVGIGSMGTAFELTGTSFSESLLTGGASPLVSLFVGILATTLVQSSSTTTSLVVGLVATDAVAFESAIYMVMGANVGTTVTNSIVSLGHITRSSEYERAFAAATVHDFFNVIVLAVLFPLEVYTGFLTWLADGAVAVFAGVGGAKLASPIKIVTEPGISVIEAASFGSGPLMIVLSVALTFCGLIGLVKILRRLMVQRLESLFDRTIFRTPLLTLVFGILLTAIVQSSSITTSLVVPLVGAGILTVRQIFPFTMGANIGTTLTAVLASLAALAAARDPAAAHVSVRVAFHHVMFNVVGVAVLWFCRGFPVRIAEGFAKLALYNRAIPIVYIILVFYLLPLLIIVLGS